MEGILDFVGFIINVGYLFLFSGCDVNWGWVGGWEMKGFISGQFYSNYVTFANSIHVGMANSECSLCSVFIVKFWCEHIMSFFLPNSLSSFVYLDSFLEFFCLLEFLIAWGVIVNSLCLEYLLACKMGKGADLKIGFRISLWCELVLTISITIKGVI